MRLAWAPPGAYASRGKDLRTLRGDCDRSFRMLAPALVTAPEGASARGEETAKSAKISDGHRTQRAPTDECVGAPEEQHQRRTTDHLNI